MASFFRKTINLFRIIYYFILNTTFWPLLFPYMDCVDLFNAGSLDGLIKIGVQVLLVGKEKNKVQDFKGIILPSHKGFCDFYMQCGLGFPRIVSRYIFMVKCFLCLY